MDQMKRNVVPSTTRLLPLLVAALAILLTSTAYAATPGITGTTFNLTAQAAYITQPDGRMLYSWGYGCNGAPIGYAPVAIHNTFCTSSTNCTKSNSMTFPTSKREVVSNPVPLRLKFVPIAG